MSFARFTLGENCYCVRFDYRGPEVKHVTILERQYHHRNFRENLDSPRHSTSDINHNHIRYYVQCLDNTHEAFWITGSLVYKTREDAEAFKNRYNMRSNYQDILKSLHTRVLALEMKSRTK